MSFGFIMTLFFSRMSLAILFWIPSRSSGNYVLGTAGHLFSRRSQTL